MSKKSQRKVSRPASPDYGKAASAAAPSAPAVRPSSAGRPTLSVEFKPDYTEIIRDLKMTGILAASFIAILVVLSFFLR